MDGDGQLEDFKRAEGKEGAELGPGGSRTTGRCSGRKSVGLGHWPLLYQPIYEGLFGVGVRILPLLGLREWTILLRALVPHWDKGYNRARSVHRADG